MTEREEFNEWFEANGFLSHSRFIMWTTWQAARKSRWRSIESLCSTDNIIVHWPNQEDWMVIVRGKIGQSPRYNPDAWHPLPDPPTKEELEALR